MLIGGKSRAAVALNPEKTRFISLCIRRSSVNGSKPNRGNSESAMVHLLHVHPGNACGWRLAQCAGKNFQRLTSMTANLTTRAGGGGIQIGHILTAKRHDRGRPSLVRPSLPA